MAEDGDSDDLVTKRDELKGVFRVFELAHEVYAAQVTKESDIEECYKYFQEAQSSYINILKEIKAYIEQASRGSPATGSINPANSDQNIHSLINLPKVEIEVFSGDPLKYHAFIAVFDECVEGNCVDSGARLTRLLQYTDGKARKAIRACAVVGGQAGYNQAREILAQRFGNKHTISDAMMEKLRNGKPVHRKEDIQELSDDLASCVITLKQMNKLHEINTQRAICDIVDRLPRYFQSRWKKSAVTSKKDTGDYPDIVKFLEFVGAVADEVNDPIYGYRHHEDRNKKSSKPAASVTKHPFTRSFNTSVSSGSSPSPSATNNQKHSSGFNHVCPLCAEGHRLFGCQAFKAKKPLECLNFVKSKNLCHNCLLDNHVTSDCRKPGRCTVCNEKHTRFIHVDDSNNVRSTVSSNCLVANDSSVSQVENVEIVDNIQDSEDKQTSYKTHVSHVSNKVLLPVVPVVVNESYHTCALLDNASTNSFCTQELVDCLNLHGVGTVLNLCTLEKPCSEKETEVVSLRVSSDGETLHMSDVYVIKSIPVPNMGTRAEYQHLVDIPFPQGNSFRVDILIGQDCSEALIPLEVKRGSEGDPYAVRTLLGWSISGPLADNRENNKNVCANYIKLDKQVEKMWQTENELLSEDKAMSKEDQAVIDLWEKQGKLYRGHYELPIPWIRQVDGERQPNTSKNRAQAVTRFNSLKRRLERDKKLKLEYSEGIKGLLSKEYAEAVPEKDLDRKDGKVFYLPHHPVINVNKDKIRIVFDCSAKHKGTSLNDQVLQGPDLTNKLTSVLLRFREDKVAVIGDVEAMYHQVRVPTKDRDMLRFLWFEENDTGGRLKEYRMTVHLFGGIWSSSAANYALRRTADDHGNNEGVHSSEAAESILMNFYVDDLWSSPQQQQMVWGERFCVSHIV